MKRLYSALLVLLLLPACIEAKQEKKIIDADLGWIASKDGKCRNCPEGSECDGGAELPLAAPGWWTEPGGDIDTLEFHSCLTKTDACTGGNSTCADGYSGRLCSVCEGHRYKYIGRCFSCPATVNVIFSILLLIVIAQVSVELLPWFASGDRSLNSLSLSFNYLQIVATYVDFSVQWPGAAESTYGAFQWTRFKFPFGSPECIWPLSYGTKWSFTMLLPVFVLILFGLMYLRVRIFNALVTKYRHHITSRYPVYFGDMEDGKSAWFKLRRAVVTYATSVRKMDELRDYYVNGYTYFLYFMYLPLSMAALEPFDCTQWNSGEWTLDADPTIKCFVGGTEWILFAPWGVLFVLLYPVGIPALFFFILRNNRNRLANPITKRRWCSIYFRFEADYYWWELVIMGRKLGIAFSLIFFTEHPVLQLWNATLVMMISCYLQIKNRPFLKKVNDDLEQALLICALLTLYSGFVFNDSKFASGTYNRFFMQLVVMGIVVYSLLLIIRFLWRETKQESWMGLINLVVADESGNTPSILKFYTNLQLRWIISEFFNKRYHAGFSRFCHEAAPHEKAALRKFMIEINQVKELLKLDYDSRKFPMQKYIKLDWMPALSIWFQMADESQEKEIEAVFTSMDNYISVNNKVPLAGLDNLRDRATNYLGDVFSRNAFGQAPPQQRRESAYHDSNVYSEEPDLDCGHRNIGFSVVNYAPDPCFDRNDIFTPRGRSDTLEHYQTKTKSGAIVSNGSEAHFRTQTSVTAIVDENRQSMRLQPLQVPNPVGASSEAHNSERIGNLRDSMRLLHGAMGKLELPPQHPSTHAKESIEEGANETPTSPVDTDITDGPRTSTEPYVPFVDKSPKTATEPRTSNSATMSTVTPRKSDHSSMGRFSLFSPITPFSPYISSSLDEDYGLIAKRMSLKVNEHLESVHGEGLFGIDEESSRDRARTNTNGNTRENQSLHNHTLSGGSALSRPSNASAYSTGASATIPIPDQMGRDTMRMEAAASSDDERRHTASQPHRNSEGRVSAELGQGSANPSPDDGSSSMVTKAYKDLLSYWSRRMSRKRPEKGVGGSSQ